MRDSEFGRRDAAPLTPPWRAGERVRGRQATQQPATEIQSHRTSTHTQQVARSRLPRLSSDRISSPASGMLSPGWPIASARSETSAFILPSPCW
jgi:hypothetical protein